jgi:hypothetical protein
VVLRSVLVLRAPEASVGTFADPLELPEARRGRRPPAVRPCTVKVVALASVSGLGEQLIDSP